MGSLDRNAWNDRYRTTDLVWTADANRFVVAEATALHPGRVLDLAAGEGRNAIWLAERGWQATVVDFADVALEKARRLAKARGVHLDTVVADVRTYEPAARAFDLVLIAYLQLPRAQLSVVLERAQAAVAPGGELLVVAHDRSNVTCGYGGPQDPLVLATPEEVVGLVPELHILKAECVERPVDTPDGPQVAIDHVVRARRPEPD